MAEKINFYLFISEFFSIFVAYINMAGALYLNMKVLSAEEKKQLWHEFNKGLLQFYQDWNEILQGREEGPDMDESYDLHQYYFCERHNIPWEQLLLRENNKMVDAYINFFEKHRNFLDILRSRQS